LVPKTLRFLYGSKQGQTQATETKPSGANATSLPLSRQTG